MYSVEKSGEQISLTYRFGKVDDNLLDYPTYTKPRVYENMEVPEVLLSGHHANINKWREEMRKRLTELRKG